MGDLEAERIKVKIAKNIKKQFNGFLPKDKIVMCYKARQNFKSSIFYYRLRPVGATCVTFITFGCAEVEDSRVRWVYPLTDIA